MRIREIRLRGLRMKLIAPFGTSTMRTDERRIVLVEVDVDGVTGWAECVAGETPGYSPETTETAWHVLRDHLWPLLRGEEFGQAAKIWEMLEPVRRHNMAKGALEAAIWDADASQQCVPLPKLFGG